MNRTTFSLVLVMALLLPRAVCGQKVSAQYQAYVEQYRDLAIEQMLRYRIPASITLAQGILESRGGMSDLAVKGNNHFGIKCHGWSGRTMHHDDDAAGECFRVYDNARESFEDHSKFLANGQRYSTLFTLRQTDYQGWARGLRQCGYATSPTYAESLIRIIELYGLSEYDKATSYDKFMAQKVSKDHVAANGGLLHPIHIYNKNYYLQARRGDTFKSIGEEVNIGYGKLAKRNERGKHDELAEGDVIYLKKKQRRALELFKGRPHVVRAGESMYLIAQMYGIRLKSLYKMNGLGADYVLREGDRLRVR